MEDEDDIYGFGALSDMFDSRSSTASARDGVGLVSRADVEPKRLDVAAMSRFWWSERRLDEFRRGPQRHAKEYHHVAAKFDGTHVDGGLGSVFLVPRGRSESSGRVEDGGVLWIQAQASDSNAQARRKKEFQDITNRLPLLDRQDALKTPKGSSKSTATVFLSTTEILDAKETRVQNTMQGITFTLRSGPQFEITFMPGPFYDARNRDEVLEAFNRQQVDDVFSPESSPQSTIVRQHLPLNNRSRAPSSPNAPRSQPSSREQTPETFLTDALTSVTSTPTVQDPDSLREANRELVRRYVQLDKGSTEAIAIAQKIYSSSHYHVGPLAPRIPDFSADLAYRKRTCIELDRKIKKLTRDWALSEQERELHTRARCGKSRDDVLQYTDTITAQPLSSSSYRERYVNFVEAEHPESHSIIRMVEPRILATNVSGSQQESPLRPVSSGQSGAIPHVRPSSPATSYDECKLFGIDFRHSALVDPALILKWQSMPLSACEDLAEWRDLVSESAVSKASSSFAARVAEMIKRQPVKPTAATESTSYDDDQLRRRSTSRRRSLDQVHLEDVRAHFDVSNAQGSSDLSPPNSAKRRRSDGGTSGTAGRRRRRQSLVGSLDTSMLEEGKTGESSPSTSDAIQPMDSVCPLCCDADAVVVMKPCGHSVCRACWGRLVRVEDESPRDGVDTRQCPWDRAHVIEREARPPPTSHVKSSQ